MKASFDLWSIFFLICASQGLLLGILLISKQKSRIQNIQLLGLLILSFSLMLFFYVAYWTGLSQDIHRIFSIPYSFVWLTGPLCYSYIRSITLKDEINGWHFIPFLIFFTYMGAGAFIQPIANLQIAQWALWDLFTIGLVLQLVIYSILIYRHTTAHSDRWTNLIGYLYHGFVAGNLVYWILVATGQLNPTYDYIISVFIAAFIYTIGYYGFNEEQLFQKKKYSQSDLTNTALRFLGSKLEDIMEKEKPYLQHGISLQELAEMMEISKHQLSQIINERFNVNYFDFINGYRINDAIEILKQPDNFNIKIHQLAIKVGFNNKVTFNNAFKKVTGKSPLHFKKSIHETA